METAIVAGVGPGLGASLARAFARQGYAIGLYLVAVRQAVGLLKKSDAPTAKRCSFKSTLPALSQ